MSARQISTRIPLQVGSELRIRDNCELRVSNPTLEIMSDEHGRPLDPEEAADAALDYRFDPETAEHVIRLLSPGNHGMS
jgi:hypothetical protein